MMSKNNEKFTLIMQTMGGSIKRWHQVGMCSRELAYYDSLSERVGPLHYFTYGNKLEDNSYLKEYKSNSQAIMSSPGKMNQIRYGGLLSSFWPFYNLDNLDHCKLIRSNQFAGSWLGLRFAQVKKIPFILRCGYIFSEHYKKKHPQSIYRHKFYRKMEHKVANKASAVIVTFRQAKDFFINNYGINPDKIHVLGNPIDTSLFKPIKSTSLNDKKDVISVAKFTDQKNLKELIIACSKLNLNLTLIGDGPLKASLKKLANQLESQVTFMGKISNKDLPQVISQFKVFVLPSLFEGNPKALLEALSCSIPSIASSIPENINLIGENKYGKLCEFDSESIKKSLSYVLGNYEVSLEKANSARMKIISDYSISSIAKKEADLHKSLLN